MKNIMLWVWIALFFVLHSVCLSQKPPQSCYTPSDYKCSGNRAGYRSTHLFSTIIICCQPKIYTFICKDSLGMAGYAIKKKRGLSHFFRRRTKIVTFFSFENFASMLIYLQYKKIDIEPIKSAFENFWHNYANEVPPIVVSCHDYIKFRKKFITFCKSLPQSARASLLEYISFFEYKIQAKEPE